jgi:hypothetical protein
MLKVEDKLWWSKATKKNTQRAYENYLVDYPNGIYSFEAKQKIDEFIAIEIEKELERKRLAEIERRKEEERLVKIEKEKARLAEIKNIKEQARQTEIRRKKEEEARLAEIARKNEEIRLAKISNQRDIVIGGMIGAVYISICIYSLGFLGGLGLIIGSIVLIIIGANIINDELFNYSLIGILIINIYFIFIKDTTPINETNIQKSILKENSKNMAKELSPSPYKEQEISDFNEFFSEKYIFRENSKALALSLYKKEAISNNANEFISFFSYPVTKYYREEYASKEFILKDKEKYFRDWGQRIYKNIRVNIIDIIANDGVKIKVVFDYVLNNGIKQIEGVSTHYLTIKKINDKPLITRIELGKK